MAYISTGSSAGVLSTQIFQGTGLQPYRPSTSAALLENFSRQHISAQQQFTSQQLVLSQCYIPSGVTITSISFASGATAGATLVNQLFGIYDNDAGDSTATPRSLLRGTNDDGANAWAANTVKTLNLTSTYTTTRSGLFWIACLVNATTMPGLLYTTISAGVALQSGASPVYNRQSNTSVTSLPNPATAGTTTFSGNVWCGLA